MKGGGLVEEENNADHGRKRRARWPPTISHTEEEKGSPTMRMKKRGVEQHPHVASDDNDT
jgi:hypothetical protein